MSRSQHALRRGVAAVEFALTLPIWLALLVGTSDMTYFLLVNERTDRIAYSVTDIVTQYSTLTIANLKDIFTAAPQLMKPIAFGSKGVVIVTSVYKATGGVPRICWQYNSSISGTSSGSLVRGSKVGTKNAATDCKLGALATLPHGLVINDNDNIIISEVFYRFDPLFVSAGFLAAQDIYRVAIYKPRLSPLIKIPT